MATSIIPPDLVTGESDSGERDQMPAAEVVGQAYADLVLLGWHLAGAVESPTEALDVDGLYVPPQRRPSLVDLLGLRDRPLVVRCADCTQVECLCAAVYASSDPFAWPDRVRAVDAVLAAGQPVTEAAIAAHGGGCPPLPDSDDPGQADAWRLVAAHYGLPTDGDHAALVRAVRRMAGGAL